jgi:hypothetical protein
MGHDGESKPRGFIGWLVAILLTLSILPAGVATTGSRTGTTKAGLNDGGEGTSTAHAATSNAKDKEPHIVRTLDQKLGELFGLELPDTDTPDASGDGDTGGRTRAAGPLDASLARAIASTTSIRSMILCVADPVSSSVAFRADLQLDALQKALSAHSYVPDRWHLPWKRSPSHGKPGLIVYRKPEKAGGRRLLLVYLVGELATSGIDRQAFRAAVAHVDRIEAALPAERRSGRLPILGPVLTGSADSLGEAIAEGRDSWWSDRMPLILNWSATAVDVDRLRTLARDGNLLYGETLHRQDVMWRGVATYLSDIYWPRTPRVAWLNESGTQLGTRRLPWRQDRDSGLDDDGAPAHPPVPRTNYAFPIGISRVRDAYASATNGDGEAKPPVAPTDGAILRFPNSDSETVADTLPRFVPGMQAPYAELVLRQILLDISRNDFDVVGITATDHRDRMFLAQQIRRFAPGSQIVLLGGDIAHEHPDFRQSLRGTIVASTYPMFPNNQRWSFREPGAAPESMRYVFASQSGYALFNALSCALAWQDGRGVFCNRSSTISINSEDLPFVEYGSPRYQGSGDGELTIHTPPLWISVIGDQCAWPLQHLDPVKHEVSDQASTSTSNRVSDHLLKVLATRRSGITPTPHDIHDTHPFPLRFLLLLQTLAAGMAAWAAGVFLPIGSSGPAPSPVPAWVRPMREWWWKDGEPGVYDSAKARRLFMPLFVGLLALWLQMTVCSLHQWSTFLCGLRKPAADADNVLGLILATGTCILVPIPALTRIVLAGAIAVVGTCVLAPSVALDHLAALVPAWISVLSGMLLLRANLAIVARRKAPNRLQSFAAYAEVFLIFTTFVFTAAIHLTTHHFFDFPSRSVPWLTTVSWMFNGVSPLLPLVAACLAIGVICRSELTRCWRIETGFVAPIAHGAGTSADGASRLKNEYSYPVSGMEPAALVREGLRWLLAAPIRLPPHRLTGEPPSADVRPIPNAYLVWIGLGLFTVWLVFLLMNTRPIYPTYWFNVGLIGLIGLGYLTWAVVFAQLLALRVRFFTRLRTLWTDEVHGADSQLAKAFDAEKGREARLLGRLLYARDDSADRTPIQEPTDPADDESQSIVQARRAARGIKRWVAFVGGQLRVGAFGLALGALLLFVSVSSLPFQPRSWFQLTATLSFVALGIAVVSTMVRVDADEVLSLIAGTDPGKVTFDWALVLKLTPWVAVPLIMVLGQTFPELWNWLGVMLDGWRTP